MCHLEKSEFILLDEFIYLEWNFTPDETVNELINNLSDEKNLRQLVEKMPLCAVETSLKEWQKTIELISKKENLLKLKIKDVEDNKKTGERIAVFEDEDHNAIVIFRGTMTIQEWNDNGEGAYQYDTEQQLHALSYINRLPYENITVSGHSKGGNKAQYTAIRSSKVKRCISVNGQGFSDEFLEKYKTEIEENKYKIEAVISKYDYVNCLLNTITEERHYIKTSFQLNPLLYHKQVIMLDYDGNLREETTQSIFSKIMNDFSVSFLRDLPSDLKELTINGLIAGIEAVMCRKGTMDNFIKALGGVIIMMSYGKYFTIKREIALGYFVTQLISVPLLCWGDFIKAEELESKEILKKTIEKINLLVNPAITKIKLAEGKNHNLSMKLSEKFNLLINKLKSEENLLKN